MNRMSGPFQHLRGHRMPKQVAAPDVDQPRRSHAVAHHLRHPVIRERLACYRQEQRAIVTGDRQLRPHLVAVPGYPRLRPIADRNHPIFLVLALQDHQRAAIVIGVALLQTR
jgi:hypothetical protein